MGKVKNIKIVTKGNASIGLVNSIQKDMMYNYNEYFKKVIIRAKSITVSLTMLMDSEIGEELTVKY